ncbi:hypothetical protein JG688_00000316 [Phytophthora aleatoria]|uniref:Uncharacterized protein n=1 Tax=Phytophthora aleatoria TaxID=2496075 RepID=A0A8J5JC82_9STRA|nr:hypothetical protein JG688_00000316 [Phytophthora aleatoria]
MSDAAAAIMAVCCQRGIADRAAAAAARVCDGRRVCHRVQVVTCTVVALAVDKRDKGLPLRRTSKSNGALDAEPTTALDCEAQICAYATFGGWRTRLVREEAEVRSLT